MLKFIFITFLLSKDVKIPVHMGGKVVDGGHVIGLIRSIASDMS